MNECMNTDEVIKALYLVEHFLSQKEEVETDNGMIKAISGYKIEKMYFLKSRIAVDVVFYKNGYDKLYKAGRSSLIIENSIVYTENEWAVKCAKSRSYEQPR